MSVVVPQAEWAQRLIPIYSESSRFNCASIDKQAGRRACEKLKFFYSEVASYGIVKLVRWWLNNYDSGTIL